MKFFKLSLAIFPVFQNAIKYIMYRFSHFDEFKNTMERKFSEYFIFFYEIQYRYIIKIYKYDSYENYIEQNSTIKLYMNAHDSKKQTKLF